MLHLMWFFEIYLVSFLLKVVEGKFLIFICCFRQIMKEPIDHILWHKPFIYFSEESLLLIFYKVFPLVCYLFLNKFFYLQRFYCNLTFYCQQLKFISVLVFLFFQNFKHADLKNYFIEILEQVFFEFLLIQLV